MTKEKTKITAMVNRVRSKVGTVSDADMQKYEQGLEDIKQTVNEFKENIANHTIETSEQLVFSFMPTSMTRISPFFPLSKREMKNRPMEELTWNNSWGKLTMSGERLCVYDESVLLAVLYLMRKKQSQTFDTTQYEICKVMGVTPAKNTYNAIWEALDRLVGTRIKLEICAGKGKEEKMSNTILSGAVQKKRGLKITVNSYFYEMYASGFLTNLNLDFRQNLKGDIARALYRFYQGQRESEYHINVIKLANTINMNISVEIWRLKRSIRTGLKELKDKKYFKSYMIDKNDVVHVVKSQKPTKK